jgi:hypothetical protein
MANVEIDDLDLIEKLRAYPCLYNVKSKDFYNRNIVTVDNHGNLIYLPLLLT